MFTSLSCANCEEKFPTNVIPDKCPKCGSNSFESDESKKGLNVRVDFPKKYSLSHLQHAILHTKNSGAIESEWRGNLSGLRFQGDNEAFVTSAIFCTVAFLESTINEFFAEIGTDKKFHEIYGNGTANLIKNLWNMDFPRTAGFPVLQKYQIALTICQKEVFNTGENPFQWVYLLIRLRNYLIHAEPDNITLFTVGQIKPENNKSLDKLAGSLMGKFPVNKLMENTINPFFPDKCLGHGCAEWGIKASLSFTDEFFNRIGVTALYESMRKELITVWTDE